MSVNGDTFEVCYPPTPGFFRVSDRRALVLRARDQEGNPLDGEARVALRKGRGRFEVAGRLRDEVSVTLRDGEAELPFFPLDFGAVNRIEVALNGSTSTVAVRQPSTFLGEIREVAENIIVAFFLAILIRAFLFQAFYIPSGSMEPQLYQGDRLIASKVGIGLEHVHRGDIAIFRYPEDPDVDYIKRIVALPGDVVQVSQNKLYVNDQVVEEPYLKDSYQMPYGPVTIKPGHLLALGDNRNNSADSRYWGQLPAENLVARPLFIFWPAMRDEDHTVSVEEFVTKLRTGEAIDWSGWFSRFFHRIE